MTAVYYFSGAGHSRAIAEHLAAELGCEALDMLSAAAAVCDTAAVVFPVYGDNLPTPVKAFLPRLRCSCIALIASYGRMSHGDILSQAARLTGGQVICGAYVPTGHTYLDQSADFDKDVLAPVIERIRQPQAAVLPRERPSLLGRLFPEARGRMMVHIRRSSSCDGCGACEALCPMSSMKQGKPGRDCLRCMRCVIICPKKALSARYSPALRAYLSRPHLDKTIIYL